MNYDPTKHSSLSDYLEATNEALSNDSNIHPNSRDEILSNIIGQFERALENDPNLDEQNYVIGLEDPVNYVNHISGRDSGEQYRYTKKQPTALIKPATLALIIVLVVLAVASVYMIRVRNQIIVSEASVQSSWAQVETTLQRRYDLIPNLVKTVKGYATHESETLEEITRLRSDWANAGKNEQAEIGSQIEGSLVKVMALSEQYPRLAASEQFMALQYQLEGTENRISVARMRYNEVLRHYNSTARQFPANLFAYPQLESYFTASNEAKTAPKVQF